MSDEGVGRRGAKFAEERVEWRSVTSCGDAEGGRWMNSWVEGGMMARSCEGRGRGRIVWIVRGAEGRDVATGSALFYLHSFIRSYYVPW